MSRDAAVTLDFGDGTYRFRLGYGELEELQEAVDAGPWYILGLFSGLAQMLMNPSAVRGLSVKMVREILRIGLIGGGLKPAEALSLVRRYGPEARPADESAGIAFKVLAAALRGAEDEEEPSKKKPEEENPSTTSPEASSASESSTAPAQS